MPIPANCPAEVRFVMDISTADHHGKPMDTAMIPKENDTDRYPSPMGIPSFNPFI